MEKPFLVIEEGLRRVNGQIRRLEPQKELVDKREKGLSPSSILSWCTTVEDVRTYYKK